MSQQHTKDQIWDAVQSAIVEGMTIREFATECYESWSVALYDDMKEKEKDLRRIFLDSQIKGP